MFNFKAYIRQHQHVQKSNSSITYHDLMMLMLNSLENSRIIEASSPFYRVIVQQVYTKIREKLKQYLKDNEFKKQTLNYYPEMFLKDFHEAFYTEDKNSICLYDSANYKINKHIDKLNVKNKLLAKRKYLNNLFFAGKESTPVTNLLIGFATLEKLDVSLKKDKNGIYYLKFVTPK